jgi:hypothetical protein
VASPVASKAAITRRENAAREKLLKSQVISKAAREGTPITKATWESGSDQDYDGTGTFTPTTWTLNGMAYDGYSGPGGFYLPADVDKSGPVNLHHGRGMRHLREVSAGLRTI